MPYIKRDFPVEKLDEIVRREANAKKPVYHLHKFWARRVGSTFRAMMLATFLEDDPMKHFYRKMTLKNSMGEKPIILDPFIGGGTTVVEGLRLGAKLIGVDFNPLAWFITKKELEPVDLKKFEDEFEDLKKKVGKKIKFYYKTRCPEGHEADVMYVFWVRQVKCENCHKQVPLYNSVIIAKYNQDKATVLCTHCGEVFTTTLGDEAVCPNCKRELKTFARGKNYKCPHCGNSGDVLNSVRQEGKPPTLEMFAIEYYCPECGERGYKKTDEFDRAQFEKAKKDFEEKKSDLIGKSVPDQHIPDGFNTKQVKNFGYEYFYELFNERQLLCLSMLMKEILKIEDEMLREVFLITLSDSVNANNMMCTYNMQALKLEPLFGLGALWPPQMPVENNVWGTKLGRGTFIKYVKKAKRALKYMYNPYEIRVVGGKGDKIYVQNDKVLGRITDNPKDFFMRVDKNALLRCQTSEDLKFLGDGSVDAVITDPPYYANIMYGEISDFFYVWLRVGLRDRYPDVFGDPLITEGKAKREILVNAEVGKDENFYIEGLKRVFKECHRVLKKDGLMAFTFHHKATKAWSAVLEALLDSDFSITAAYPVHSETRSGVRKGIRYDSILVCEKRKDRKVRRIPWAIFEAQLLDRMEKDLEGALERHSDLSVEDIFVMGMGQALQIYSKNYGGVIKDGEILRVDEALETIGGTVFDILLRKVLAKAPDVDRISKIYATIFAGLERVPLDTINKITRHGGIETDIFESEHLLKRANKSLMKIISEKERKNHIESKIDRGIPLMYVDAAQLLRTARSERVKFNETLQAIIENGINKEKLAMYLHFLAERTKDVEWKRVEKSLESTEIPTLEKYM